jgi:hypothetical protein
VFTFSLGLLLLFWGKTLAAVNQSFLNSMIGDFLVFTICHASKWKYFLLLIYVFVLSSGNLPMATQAYVTDIQAMNPAAVQVGFASIFNVMLVDGCVEITVQVCAFYVGFLACCCCPPPPPHCQWFPYATNIDSVKFKKNVQNETLQKCSKCDFASWYKLYI